MVRGVNINSKSGELILPLNDFRIKVFTRRVYTLN